MISFGYRVYFARDPATRSVKIGHTYNLPLRLQFLRRTNRGLELLADIPGDRRIEDRFHMLLIEHHIGGEWFTSCPRVEAVVIAVQEGWFDIAKLPVGTSPIRRASALRGHETRRARKPMAA